MKKYTEDMVRRTAYRKARLEEAFKKIRRAVAGYDNGILPLLENEDKKIDAAKLDEMTGQMMVNLNRYFEINGKEKPDKEAEDFYRNYLYLVILTPWIDIDCRIGAFYLTSCFGDIISHADFAREISVMKEDLEKRAGTLTKEEALVVYEQHPWRMPEDEMTGLLYRAKDAYEQLTGKNVSEIYTPEEKAYLKKWSDAGWHEEPLDTTITVTVKEDAGEGAKSSAIRFSGEPDEEEFSDKEPWEIEEEKEYREYLNGLDPAEEYERQLEAWREEDEFIDGTRRDWEEYIPDKDRYIKTYEEFRKAYLSGKADLLSLPELMEYLTEAYLFEQGISAYSLDEYYGLIDKALDNVPVKIAHETVRARLFSDDE